GRSSEGSLRNLPASSHLRMIDWSAHRDEELLQPMIRHEAPAATGATPDPGVRVLVVDDETYITDLVATALRYEGFEVASAGSGREALTLVDSFRPELIVLDVMLPDLDGFEVQRRLVERGRPAPVLFLTARDATEDKV